MGLIDRFVFVVSGGYGMDIARRFVQALRRSAVSGWRLSAARAVMARETDPMVLRPVHLDHRSPGLQASQVCPGRRLQGPPAGTQPSYSRCDVDVAAQNTRAVLSGEQPLNLMAA